MSETASMSIALTNSSYLDHPSEESLERFLLDHHPQDEELDRVETHILACDACVSRLERLGIQLAATKRALHELSSIPLQARNAQTGGFWDRSSFLSLSWASAAAVVALALTSTYRTTIHPSPAVDITLAANRGSEVPTVPQGKNLHLFLNTPDLGNGPVYVTVVDRVGKPVWQETAKVQDDRVQITLPQIESSGIYFVRLYSPTSGNMDRDLLREFPFKVDAGPRP